jgi:hypothetical protein
MQSRVRGEESPTLMHSSRGSGCACVCRPCVSSAHPMAIVIAMPEVRNARLFILLSRFGYLIQMLQSKAAGRKGRLAKDLTVAPAPSELPAVHIIAGQTSESRQAHHGSARLGGEAKAESQDDLQNAKSRQAIELDNDCALPFFAPAGVRDVNRCPNASHARSSECTLCRVMRGADLPVTIRRPPQSSRTPAGGRIRFQSRDKRVGVV